VRVWLSICLYDDIHHTNEEDEESLSIMILIADAQTGVIVHLYYFYSLILDALIFTEEQR
jgi:hypothetical protein